MGSLGGLEIVVIAVVALLVFGPKRLPEVSRQVGGALRELRRVQTQVKSEIDDVLRVDDSADSPTSPATKSKSKSKAKHESKPAAHPTRHDREPADVADATDAAEDGALEVPELEPASEPDLAPAHEIEPDAEPDAGAADSTPTDPA